MGWVETEWERQRVGAGTWKRIPERVKGQGVPCRAGAGGPAASCGWQKKKKRPPSGMGSVTELTGWSSVPCELCPSLGRQEGSVCRSEAPRLVPGQWGREHAKSIRPDEQLLAPLKAGGPVGRFEAQQEQDLGGAGPRCSGGH